MRRTLYAVFFCVAIGCGDDSATTGSGGAGGAAGTGGSGGTIDAPMIDAPQPDAASDAGFMRVDAAISDAGTNTTTVTPNSVPCLNNGTPTTCTTPAEECCAVVASDAGGASVMCTTAAQCPNDAEISLACDGPEDCVTGQTCCGRRRGMLAFASTCTNAAICPNMARPMCHNHTQCPSALTSCCQIRIGGGPRFTGECYTAGMEPPNTACDVP